MRNITRGISLLATPLVFAACNPFATDPQVYHDGIYPAFFVEMRDSLSVEAVPDVVGIARKGRIHARVRLDSEHESRSAIESSRLVALASGVHGARGVADGGAPVLGARAADTTDGSYPSHSRAPAGAVPRDEPPPRGGVDGRS